MVSRAIIKKPWFIRSLLVAMIVVLILGWLWGQEPATFKVREQAIITMKQDGFEQMPKGFVYTNTLTHMLEVLVEKPGGYLSNDIALPGVVLDNVQGWEYGVSIVLRHASQVLVDYFATSPMQSNNKDYIAIWPYYYQTSYSWAFPSAEQDLKKVIKAMHLYMQRLYKAEDDKEQSHFYANPENLSYQLKKMKITLYGLSKRLKGSSEDFLSIPERFPNITIEPLFMQKTPWLLVDDYFYWARGASWALLHIFKAIKVDFEELVVEKKAMMTLNLIIFTLESSLSPRVFTGYDFEVTRADSVSMAGYFDRVMTLTIIFLELINQPTR